MEAKFESYGVVCDVITGHGWIFPDASTLSCGGGDHRLVNDGNWLEIGVVCYGYGSDNGLNLRLVPSMSRAQAGVVNSLVTDNVQTIYYDVLGEDRGGSFMVWDWPGAGNV